MSEEYTNKENNAALGAIWKNEATDGNQATHTTFKSEIQLQAKCFQWAWNNYPDTRRLMAHVPNGGGRDEREGMQLKASGVVAGVHDLFFYWKAQLYWFELKHGCNAQSDDQIAFGKAMMAQGAKCYEIRSLEQFQTIFKSIVE